jgi:phage baseplate assembly protein W
MRPSNIKSSDKKLRGLFFPFQKNKGLFPYAETDAEQIKNVLIFLFKTPIQSRVMRPTVGSDADRYVFEMQGDLLYTVLERSIRQTVLNSGINVIVNYVEFSTDETQVIADVYYTVFGVKDKLTLSFEGAEF